MSEEVINESEASQDAPAVSEDAQPTRPEGLPEKFQSVEALAESYSQLEKKLHSKAPEGIPDKPTVDEPAEEPKDEPEAAEEVTEEATDSLVEFEQEYQANGELSDESYKKLKDVHKLSRRDVEDLIEIRTQKAAAEAQAIYAKIEGGAEGYTAAIQWASTGMDAEAQMDFNEAIKGSPYTRDLAIADLMHRYKAAGSPKDKPEETQGTPVAGAAMASGDLSDKFKSVDEMQRAMRSNEYKYNETFRNEVHAKAKRSKLL